MTTRRALLAAGLGAAGAPRAAVAFDAVTRLLVAYPPGGLSDDTARHLAHALARVLGHAVTPVHQPGAGGRIAIATLARARPDGRTLCYAAVTPLTVPVGDPAAAPPDVAPVTAVLQVPALLVATPACGAHDLASVLSAARAAPSPWRAATSGVGTTGHLVLAQLRAATGIAIAHIPYQGGGPPLVDALAGRVELLLTNAAPQQLSLVTAGRLRAIAVGAPARLAALPTVPTFAEAGVPEANLASVFGVFAPGGTPAPVLGALQAALSTAIADPAWRQRLEAAGCLPLGGTPAAFAVRVAAERAHVQRLLRRAPGALM